MCEETNEAEKPNLLCLTLQPALQDWVDSNTKVRSSAELVNTIFIRERFPVAIATFYSQLNTKG